MIGAIEAVEALMGYHQSQMTRQVVFIPTDLVPPHQRMLKSKAEREPLEEDSEDIYPATRFETYTNRPHQLQSITYPEFFQWWRRATPAEHKKAVKVASNHETPTIKSKGPNDFQNFLNAQQHRDQAFAELAECFDAADVTIANSDQLLALLRMEYNGRPVGATRDHSG